MSKIYLTENEKRQIKSMYGLITETDDVIKKRCYEYRYRVNNKVTANSCDIQRFLKNIGHKISPTNVVDCTTVAIFAMLLIF